MLQNAQQELVRGNKALSLTETIGVGEGLLFVVHLWVRCHLLGSSQTGVRAPGATQACPILHGMGRKATLASPPDPTPQWVGQERIIVGHQGDASVPIHSAEGVQIGQMVEPQQGRRKRPHPSPHRSRPYANWIPSEVV